MLHPGPMNRGIEITPEVADGPQSCVLEQVTNGVAVRMAILYLLITGASEMAHIRPQAPAEHNRRATESPAKDASYMLLIRNGRVLDPASKTDAALRYFARRRKD